MLNLKKLRACLSLCIVLVTVVGCSSPVHRPPQQPTDTSEFITRSEVEPFLTQWNSKKESLERLAALEEDLKILLEVVSKQVNVTELPESLRGDIKQIEHRAENHTSGETTEVSVKLGTYFNALRADAALKKFNIQFPELASAINTHIKKINLNQSERHILVGEQLSSMQEADKLCLLLKQFSQRCEVITTDLAL
ncbi:hypothetical protein BGP78_08810 [Pseudoalteromonas sp. MSK9-3]|uniref:hypothetical protein n=1 Tax=Pseudoalteromonas sp. MSK9-3 TaxID=1897633 RepID=UPI000E6C48E9|nr:hypothetical protein [Pseudoalteromonas sp. MSK9-3]RJE77306.1 hypothetical protein BGP78_08810 [Pseudoalteromonas sp. MSK9-3]